MGNSSWRKPVCEETVKKNDLTASLLPWLKGGKLLTSQSHNDDRAHHSELLAEKLTGAVGRNHICLHFRPSPPRRLLSLTASAHLKCQTCQEVKLCPPPVTLLPPRHPMRTPAGAKKPSSSQLLVRRALAFCLRMWKKPGTGPRSASQNYITIIPLSVSEAS